MTNSETIPVEALIAELRAVREDIRKSEQRRDELEEAIIKASDKQWDMITVKKASEKSGLSVPTIYRFIDKGKLRKVEYKGSLKFVSDSELKAMNDKPKF